ncbi:hypothetical protein PLICRDRAFT_86055 [Plicaturopsis crispa FD-325 SS-3]|nr:hypothetical protein PLICRDRAFT_86055 [Plicaturopsis crispa FD-325 SS-3]
MRRAARWEKYKDCPRQRDDAPTLAGSRKRKRSDETPTAAGPSNVASGEHGMGSDERHKKRARQDSC